MSGGQVYLGAVQVSFLFRHFTLIKSIQKLFFLLQIQNCESKYFTFLTCRWHENRQVVSGEFILETGKRECSIRGYDVTDHQSGNTYLASSMLLNDIDNKSLASSIS